MKEITCLTINTDASWHPIHKCGGYAFYIVCDLFKIQKAGRFKNNPKSSEDAEIMCLGNALATLLAQKELPTAKWLIINGDCTKGMERVRTVSMAKISNKDPIAKSVNSLRLKLIQRLKSNKNKMRHVKAHNGTPDARSWVNDWCDREAKKYMRMQIPKQSTVNAMSA